MRIFERERWQTCVNNPHWMEGVALPNIALVGGRFGLKQPCVDHRWSEIEPFATLPNGVRAHGNAVK